MKVNNDKHEVHLSREMYNDLLAWATWAGTARVKKRLIEDDAHG